MYNITEILLKVALNTITLTLYYRRTNNLDYSPCLIVEGYYSDYSPCTNVEGIYLGYFPCKYVSFIIKPGNILNFNDS